MWWVPKPQTWFLGPARPHHANSHIRQKVSVEVTHGMVGAPVWFPCTRTFCQITQNCRLGQVYSSADRNCRAHSHTSTHTLTDQSSFSHTPFLTHSKTSPHTVTHHSSHTHTPVLTQSHTSPHTLTHQSSHSHTPGQSSHTHPPDQSSHTHPPGQSSQMNQANSSPLSRYQNLSTHLLDSTPKSAELSLCHENMTNYSSWASCKGVNKTQDQEYKICSTS